MKFRNNRWQKKKVSYGLPFNLARFFSVVSLVVVLCSSVIMAFFIGQNTTSTLLSSQKDYALLLAENLNSQLFRNFIAPRLLAQHGGISLGEDEQYRLLNELVLMLVHGLHIETIRIYDDNFSVTYSNNADEVGKADIFPHAVPQVFSTGNHSFDVLSSVPYSIALIKPRLNSGSFQLRTTYPLTMDPKYLPFIESVVGPLPLEEGQLLGVLEITQDITSHYALAIRSQRLIIFGFLVSCVILFILIQIMAKQAERILAERVQRNLELEANLHQSEKLASMGRMVASIAHEIRNPLGIIRSSAELLIRRMKGEDTSRPILEAIYDESCRLGVVVNDFLDYARPKQPKSDAVDLYSVFDKACGFLSAELSRHGVECKSSFPEDITVYGDPDLLYRAFYNILVNAAQAMDNGGLIKVNATKESDNTVRIIFHDSGPGFDLENMSKPLDPFYTTKDTGTGLGLPIVQSIITGHRGSIVLGNAEEGGAVIEVILPLNKAEE